MDPVTYSSDTKKEDYLLSKSWQLWSKLGLWKLKGEPALYTLKAALDIQKSMDIEEEKRIFGLKR